MHKGIVLMAVLLTVGCGHATKAASTPAAGVPSPAPAATPTERVALPAPPAADGASCEGLQAIETFTHSEIGQISLHRDVRRGSIAFASQMAVNTDGAPDSYHPDDIGITHICNGVSVGSSCTWKADCLPDFRQAKSEGFRGPTKVCFFAMVTDEAGVPIGRDVVYVLFPGSRRAGELVTRDSIEQEGRRRVADLGGDVWLRRCGPGL